MALVRYNDFGMLLFLVTFEDRIRIDIFSVFSVCPLSEVPHIIWLLSGIRFSTDGYIKNNSLLLGNERFITSTKINIISFAYVLFTRVRR